jgi:hypothetical protein
LVSTTLIFILVVASDVNPLFSFLFCFYAVHSY